MLETQVQSLGCEDPLEEEMVTHSSIPKEYCPWEIPRTGEPGGLQFTKNWTWLSGWTQHTLICTTPGCYTLNIFFFFFLVSIMYLAAQVFVVPHRILHLRWQHTRSLVVACEIWVPDQGFIPGPPALGVPCLYIDFFNPTSRQPSCLRYCYRH